MVHERSLTLSCPVAAELILFEEEPLKFEKVQLSSDNFQQIKVILGLGEFIHELIPLQETAISILQQRRLSIDARLIVLGFYFRQLEEIFNRGEVATILTLNKIYTSEEFLVGQVPLLLDSVKFQPKEFVMLMSSVIEKIRGGSAEKFLSQINFDVSATVRKKFLKKYSLMLENYLVNEFFGGCYPFKVNGTIQHNYAIFAVNFKILETAALSLCVKNSARKILDPQSHCNNKKLID